MSIFGFAVGKIGNGKAAGESGMLVVRVNS